MEELEDEEPDDFKPGDMVRLVGLSGSELDGRVAILWRRVTPLWAVRLKGETKTHLVSVWNFETPTEPEAVTIKTLTEPEAVTSETLTEPEAVTIKTLTEPEAVTIQTLTEREAVTMKTLTEPEAVTSETLTEPEAVNNEIKIPRYCIIGTWDDWAPHGMAWNAADKCFEFLVHVGATDGNEHFRLLVEGDWDLCLHPDRDNACPGDGHKIVGPNDVSYSESWGIMAEQGAAVKVRLEVDADGSATRVTWASVESPLLPPGGLAAEDSDEWSSVEEADLEEADPETPQRMRGLKDAKLRSEEEYEDKEHRKGGRRPRQQTEAATEPRKPVGRCQECGVPTLYVRCSRCLLLHLNSDAVR